MENQVEQMKKEVEEIHKTTGLILQAVTSLPQPKDCNCQCGEELRRSLDVVQSLQLQTKTLIDENEAITKQRRDLERQVTNIKTQVKETENCLLLLKNSSATRSETATTEHTPEVKSTVFEAQPSDKGRGQARGKRVETEELHKTNRENVETEENVVVWRSNGKTTEEQTEKETGVSSASRDCSRHIKDHAQSRESIQQETYRTSEKPTNDLKNPEDKMAKSANHQSKRKQLGAELIQRPSKRYMKDGELFWRGAARNILALERTRAPNTAEMYTVFCVDTSESMAEDSAWEQANKFIMEYFSEIDDIVRKAGHRGYKYECVSMVTFGNDTKVQVTHEKCYQNIRNVMHSMKLCGPTPLLGGLLLAQAVIKSPENNTPVANGEILMKPKIVVITDGHVTDINLQEGPDVAKPTEIEETRKALIRHMKDYESDGIDVFCIPVGEANEDFLHALAAAAKGQVMTFLQGRRLARRNFLCCNARCYKMLPMYHGDSTSEEDKEDIEDILTRSGNLLGKLKSGTLEHISFPGIEGLTMDTKLLDVLSLPLEEQKYRESSSDILPKVGSRVRRGEDWKYNEQDSHGPGTVIGHTLDGQGVWVEWDADAHQNMYRYGLRGQFDILVLDEGRELGPGKDLAVGCLVRPGKNNRDHRIKIWDKGVVIKLLTTGYKKAEVRWENGNRGEYSYGETGNQEVEIWKESGVILSNAANSGSPRTVLKKNKNV